MESTACEHFFLARVVNSRHSVHMDTTKMTRQNTRPCKACGAVTSVMARYEGSTWATEWGVSLRDNGAIVIPCRGCGKLRYGRAVIGKVSRKHICNDKCMASFGPSCECSCGGKNHGAGHAA